MPITVVCYFLVAAVVQYSQTVPIAGVVPCLNERVELTCKTDTGVLFCKVYDTNGTVEFFSSSSPQTLSQNGNFSFTVTAVDGDIITSTANIGSVDASFNGTMIGCADGFASDKFVYLRINATGPPKDLLPVDNITITPINNSSLLISWTNAQHCISYNNITIASNETYTENHTINISPATIHSLIIGTNYSFVIIPIDTIGREGPPSSLIQYIWNVPAQVVNISWDQISTDNITIWWNSTEDIRPPINYYIVNVYNTTDGQLISNDTNATITGLSPINKYYTVTIIPVNAIGYGLSATVNAITTNELTTRTSTTGATIIALTSSTMIPTSTAGGSNAVPIISGVIGTVLVIIMIIIILIIILVYAKKHRIKNKESHTANGNGNESKGVTGGSYRNNNIELQPTDPTYATPTTEYTPAAASTVRTLQGGDGPPSYPPPPPTGYLRKAFDTLDYDI
uniref:Fibronectin type-III domain-containing protein n=1 Tax=Amphimedon queenslandica TaxID=400682 RepID=A0A1X7THB9_AMPQE